MRMSNELHHHQLVPGPPSLKRYMIEKLLKLKVLTLDECRAATAKIIVVILRGNLPCICTINVSCFVKTFKWIVKTGRQCYKWVGNQATTLHHNRAILVQVGSIKESDVHLRMAILYQEAGMTGS